MTTPHQPEAAVSSLHIVVAEDEETVRFTIQRLLENLGHCAEPVTNGQELIDRCLNEGKQPDVIITDLMMPIVDGITAIERISRARLFPFIAISGNLDDSIVERALRAGCDDFVAKDCLSASQLRIGLQVALAHYRFRQGNQSLLKALMNRSDKISRAKMVLLRYWGVPPHQLDKKFEELAASQGDEAAADSVLALDPSSGGKSISQSPAELLTALLS